MKSTDVLQRLYDAFAAGDTDALGSLIGDADWVEASGGPYGGRYRGLAEVAANVFGPIARDVGNFSAVPDQLLQVGEDRALGLGFIAVRRPPARLKFASRISRPWMPDGSRTSNSSPIPMNGTGPYRLRRKLKHCSLREGWVSACTLSARGLPSA